MGGGLYETGTPRGKEQYTRTMNIKHAACGGSLIVAAMLSTLTGCASTGGTLDWPTASGTFEGTLTMQSDPEGVGDPSIARMSIDKRFYGELEAVSKGQLLVVRSEVAGSGEYVAIERVVGTLAGRTGEFVLQHISTMQPLPIQWVMVVPDSGTGELVGLGGFMTINNVSGEHSYDFEYWFETPPSE